MSHPRLSLALAGGLTLGDGAIAVLTQSGEVDLSDLPQDRCQVLARMKPDHDRFAAQGFQSVTDLQGRFSASIVFLPRAKPLARQWIALAAASTDGPVIVDGQKTDGIDSLLKELRKLGEVSSVISKAHGKLFCFAASTDLTGWAGPAETRLTDGFVTRPGVFSADGIDPASALLVSVLPEKLGKHLADLGAGWGYLSRHLLGRDSVKSLALVEADHSALDCAQRNIDDARAQFCWADATLWKAERRLDAVVMNPPFHSGRATNPELGQAFIRNAARNLAPNGTLWLVANKQLPYESTLADHFTNVEQVVADNRFKVLSATRPSRQKR